MGTVYDKIYELMDRHEDTFLIMGGDFKACMIASEDSINRNKSLNEEKLTDFIKANNDTCEVVDAYRTKEKNGGYTWTRQLCQSRLDYVFVSKYLSTYRLFLEKWKDNKMVKSPLIWVILPLIQPKVATQQKNKKKSFSFLKTTKQA